MRDYGIVSPQFWTGSTGRRLRGNADAQVVALYLMTSPHASMIGLYHCPLVYVANDTGLPLEGASKALASLCEAGFCEVDATSDTVFVVNMATHQVGETLKPTDNRVESVRRHLRQIGKNPLVVRFLEVYGERYGVTAESVGLEPLRRGLKAPPKPRAGTGSRTRTGTSNDAACAARFDEWWEIYPNKTAAKLARKKWNAKGLDEIADKLIADVKARMASDRKWREGFVPNPTTYINQERWNDGVQTSAPGKEPTEFELRMLGAV